jgi:hypothetical protein
LLLFPDQGDPEMADAPETKLAQEIAQLLPAKLSKLIG